MQCKSQHLDPAAEQKQFDYTRWENSQPYCQFLTVQLTAKSKMKHSLVMHILFLHTKASHLISLRVINRKTV